ncbi:uncharacterized protein LOC113315877 [Papaver somniferum]|uniref:uncharacterized protein LOC113315877 n=1 Tax=Papaver somniferum TaxID=3469 RepID=UPI000E6F52B3|nr:uncharacterized protein LOC113315877 [Papaver somniferum]
MTGLSTQMSLTASKDSRTRMITLQISWAQILSCWIMVTWVVPPLKEWPANGLPWLFICYYGSPYDFNSKVESWNMLAKTDDNNQLPWLVIGDFNIILHDIEKFSSQPIDTNEVVFFHNKILDLDLVDLGTTGFPFTWSNMRIGHALTKQTLGRGLATKSWLILYPNTTISNMMDIGAFLIARRLKYIKFKLRVWNKEVYGYIKTNINECKQHLHFLHNKYFIHDRNQALALDRKHLKDWQDIEEKFWKTKNRDQFIKLGDQNRNYFHRATKSRTRRNKIDIIQDNKGAWITDYQEVKNCFTHHFSTMNKTENPTINPEIIDLIHTTITIDENTMLNRTPDYNEVMSILFSMEKDKALGPDGFPPNFFKPTGS